MKTKDLIAELQRLDPEGDTEVCVNNIDIYFLSVEHAYWDGSLQVLSRDESKKPYYNLTGGKYVRHGRKVVLHPVSIDDVVRDNPETAVVDYSELGQGAEQTKEQHEKIRQSARDLERELDRGYFVAWAKKRAAGMYPEYSVDEVKELAESYYDANLIPNAPLKVLPPKKDAHGNEWWPSVVDRRESQWDDTVEIRFDGWWHLIKRGTIE